MKIAEINMCSHGSTGKIMFGIAECAREKGHIVETYSGYIYSKVDKSKPEKIPNHNLFGSKFGSFLHAALGKVFAKNGFYSYWDTKKLIRQLKKYNPDVLHLHNLHAFCINLPLLFKYIKKNDVRTVWTLHDCWAFTGHCPHFDMIGCEKWRTGCGGCTIYKDYPKVYWDNSKAMFKKKRKMFTGVENMTLVTPSAWLADLVKQSFLKDYPVKVINNGIDLNIFKPTKSNFREKYNCKDKFIVLGVAFGWGKRKGLDVFLELAKRLDERFQIVLVGTDENVDKQLPQNIISIHRTQNQTELAGIYTVADVFVNPTREEVLGLVNIESLACGTPVITFKTGGSPESIDETCGIVVEKNDIDGMHNAIMKVKENSPFSREDCLNRAKSFDKETKFIKYIELYNYIKRDKN